jgi:2-keto-4-pentenoate hydratase/2-oxohepta-3-ene-1,7-dioic acid hydratase in catechol pathway
MKLARAQLGSDIFWVTLELDSSVAHRIDEPFASWAPRVTESGSNAALQLVGDPLPLSGLTLLAPLEPGVCVVAGGANYLEHLRELGKEMPSQPTAFLKANRAIVGPDDDISHPPLSTALDYEIELVAIMGKDFDGSPTSQRVLGFCIGNDVSDRDQQFSGTIVGMDMFSAKSLDASSPLGPWVVTPDELGSADKPDLEMTLKVNGKVRQHDRTSSMEWGLDGMGAYVEARAKLQCGDVLWTGTPSGIGHSTGEYLKPGDVVTTTIEGLGTQRNTVVAT